MIGIVPPAGKVNPQFVDNAKQFLEASGYVVKIATNSASTHFQYAGTDDERISAVQNFLDDDQLEAIVFARGGYGSIRIVEKLNFEKFEKHPKWLIGFSDITVFHSVAQNRLNMASIHSPMASSMNLENDCDDFKLTLQLLVGQADIHQPKHHALNRAGNAEGVLIGGNLSLIQALRGTHYDIKPKGKILFIEDVNEYLYHLDRMMQSLKLSGILEKISGLVVGQFTSMKDNDSPFGLDPYQIIQDAVKDYNYPVIYDYPAGHVDTNYPLILGHRVSMKVTAKKAILSYID